MSATTKKILVVNSKGGSGKTTIATNLAVAFANQGLKVSLLDCDRQASCLHWAEERNAQAPKVTTVANYHSADKLTAQIDHELDHGTDVIVDGYGDRLGMRQDSLNRYGNKFIRTNYPEIDFIKKATILN